MLFTATRLSSVVIFTAFLLLVIAGCSDRSCPVADVDKVDHSIFDAVLGAVVAPNGLVDYQLLSSDYASSLDKYLSYIAGIDASSLPRRSGRLAFWLNAYNALCLRQVIDMYPSDSVYFDDPLFFDRHRYFISGSRRSLNEIRDDILRCRFNDPRIFSALCFAARSGPPLRPEAYDPSSLNHQLDNQCRLWIATESLNHLDISNNCLYLSAIFKNFAQDFDRLYDNPSGFYLKYTPDAAYRRHLQLATTHSSSVAAVNAPSIRYLKWDWSLNSR